MENELNKNGQKRRPRIIRSMNQSSTRSMMDNRKVIDDQTPLEWISNHNYIICERIHNRERNAGLKLFQLRKNDQLFEAKIIEYHLLSTDLLLESLSMERKILRLVRHPYIFRLNQLFNNDRYTIIITEPCTDGTLFHWIQSNRMNISIIKNWFQQILQSIVYLHSMGIAHRDINAHNIMLCNGLAKLANFTYAQFSLDSATNLAIKHWNKPGFTCPEYRAPETFIAPYDSFIADCYSLGVLLYYLTTGYYPFSLNNINEKREIIVEKQPLPTLLTRQALLAGKTIRLMPIDNKISKNNDLTLLYNQIMEKNWKSIGEITNDINLYSLIKQLLNGSIYERISASQALEHQWLSY